MKRFAVCILLLVSASDVCAQDAHRFTFFFSPGPSVPIAPDDFSEYWNIGPGVSAGVAYAITPVLAGMVMLDANLFTVREDKAAASVGRRDTGFDVSGGRITVFSVTGNLKAYLTPQARRTRLYVYGGGGLYKLGVDGQGISVGTFVIPLALPQDESTTCAQLGVGTEIIASTALSFIIEGRYVVGFMEDESRQTIQVRLGVKTR